jgi:hypothetical protein
MAGGLVAVVEFVETFLLDWRMNLRLAFGYLECIRRYFQGEYWIGLLRQCFRLGCGMSGMLVGHAVVVEVVEWCTLGSAAGKLKGSAERYLDIATDDLRKNPLKN